MNVQTLFEGENIKKLLPQRNPILMVDTLYSADDVEGVAGLTVQDDNFFCEDGIFTEPGLIEHIAQSASAFVGYKALQNGADTPVGYIGEVKKFRLMKLPEAGSRLVTRIHIMSEVMNITLFSAETTADGQVVATCQMKLSV